MCPSNTFERSYDGRRACFNCNASETCATDTQLTEIDISNGYWRQNTRTADIRLCPLVLACGGGPDASAYCVDHHTGPYCSLCEEAYYLDTGDNCQPCTSSALSISVVGICLVLVALVLAFAALRWLVASRFISPALVGSVKVTGRSVLAFVQVVLQIDKVRWLR